MLQFGRAVGRAEVLVLLHQQHAWANPHEARDRRAAEAAAVGHDVERPKAAAQRREVKELAIQCLLRKLEQQHAASSVPIKRDETIALLQARSAGADGLHFSRSAAALASPGGWLRER